MRIIITQTTLVIEFPDEQEREAPKPQPPFSFLDLIRREVERFSEFELEPREIKHHGPFLAQ
ncbi:MAG TPA: hypothetical protein DEB39_07835 [Planctomycetaceae bacterium]|nr:hypothetical protein [Planctomycetaceae bacterium]